MASLKDVAKLASVSLMTVSRALNDPDKLSAKTLEKVNSAIKQLNYVPDLSAQKIRGNNAGPKSIGVLGLETAITPFSVEIHQAIEQTAQAFGWNTFIVNLFDDKDPEHAVNTLLSYRPNGIIYTSMGLRKIEVPQALKKLPIVLANCLTDGENESFPTYIPNDYEGQYKAMENVLIQGYKKPLCLFLSEQIYASSFRKEAALKAWQDAGHRPEDLKMHFLPYYKETPELEYTHTIHILESEQSELSNYDVIVCGNDRVAFVVYQYLLTKGLQIPRDIAVLGFDDMVGVGQLFYPPLTTVQLPHYELGKQAALHLIKEKTHKTTTMIPCPFIKRNSL